ncbi:PREDICTED: ermin [Chinchilla lanigera]|uniref:Ermin n=1 Tax=Chinchilla lanigera TaxID=34839 RepID=A0A8C2URC1_CHILA|nr:PREDICTED: ermin [Chinchilla lanigera]
MTDVPATFTGAECNGDSPREHDQQRITKISDDVTDVDYRVEPSGEDFHTKGNEGEDGKSQGNMLLDSSIDEKILKENPEENLFIVHKAITDLSLQETTADEMTFRKGPQWEKIPLSSTGNQEISRTVDGITEQPLEETDAESKSKAHSATEIEWLGFRRPSQVVVLHSKQEEEEEVWDEETNDDNCNDDEDEVRVIEFKKKHEKSPQFKDEGDVSEDSPLSSPSSQPVTPDEPPTLGKKGDISRNAYSRYNTISYRKIRKGNTKQRIDEFESMMHL